jgi:hypothetical protein
MDHPEIAELDLNPLLAFPDGSLAVDGRVALHSDEASTPGDAP